MANAIDIRLLSKTFGKGTRALCAVDLSIEPGEMVALIGASGSGKSTLLRHISGLVTADRQGKASAGDVCCIDVFGEPIQANGRIARGIRKRRSAIGFVFQQFNLVNRLTVLTNVLTGALGRTSFWRTMFGRFPEEEKRRALQALHRVGISDQAEKRASELSGGQQQRAAIARAIAQGARIVLADEPIASLDPESARIIMELLADLNRNDGTTVVVSLHQVDFAMRYCPRTVALRDGEVVFDGPTSALTRDKLKDLYGSSVDELFGAAHETVRDQAKSAGAHPKADLAKVAGAA